MKIPLPKEPQRQAYGEALAEYGLINPDVVVLDADVSSSTLTSYFALRFPQRFFNLGVTEASMVDVGVGLALCGKIPFINTFAALLTLRACEQIRTCVAYAEANVKLVGGYAGISDYKDGPTHFAVNDVALMRAMPNMAVVAPADNLEAARLVKVLAEYPGPVYMRISRASAPDIFDLSYQPQVGKGALLRAGKDITLISSGYMAGRCKYATDILVSQGIDVRLLSFSSLKPIDQDMLLQAAQETAAIVTVEDHSVIGGLASAVMEALASSRPTLVHAVGLQDTFAQTGPDPETLMDAMGLSVENIIAVVQRTLQRARKS